MSSLKKIKDSIPSYDDVAGNPGRWLSSPLLAGVPGVGMPAAWGQNMNAKRGQAEDEAAADARTAAKEKAYKLSHPKPNMPSRTETDLTARRQAATRRGTGGRIDTILSDEGLG